MTGAPGARTSRACQSRYVETATQILHRLTSYEPGRAWDAPVDDPRVVQDLQANDPARRPWFFKRYPQRLPRLWLPRDLPATTAPAIAVLAGAADLPRTELDLAQLSRLLHLSAGVVRTIEQPYGTHPFRAAGSAGGRFPLELYVAVPEGLPLPAGVYWYSPLEHALAQVGPPPHMYWDAGTMLAQLLALADSAGLTAALYTRFPDAAVAALTGADQVHEMPVAVVGLGEAAPALEATGPAIAGEVDAAPVEFPLVTSAQRAGARDRLGIPWDQGAPVDVPVLTSAPLDSVVLARGSQRRMDNKRGLPESLLRTSMGVALRGISLPHRVVVHDVEGLAPGVYRWPDLSAPARAGALRDELHRVCLGQALARDAAFVVIAAADMDGFDDRDYREAQLAAGLAEGRLHLAAYALGASASGMTFIDSEVPSLLGEPLNALLFTCVGVPQYASAAGGPPGAPTPVRLMTSR